MDSSQLQLEGVIVHDNQTGQCLHDRVCLSTECNNHIKICCEECFQDGHSNHIEKVELLSNAYLQLKRSIRAKRVQLERTVKAKDDVFLKEKETRNKLLAKLSQCFEQMEANVINKHNSEILELREEFKESFCTTLFNQLEETIESALYKTPEIQNSIFQLANQVFPRFMAENFPLNTTFKSRDEQIYNANQERRISNNRSDAARLEADMKRAYRQIKKAKRFTSQTKMINHNLIKTDRLFTQHFNDDISQLFILGYQYLVISADAPHKPRQWIAVLDMEDKFELISEFEFSHTKLINLRNSLTFLALGPDSITKFILLGRELVIIKKIRLREPLIDAEFIPEFNLLYTITEDKTSKKFQLINMYSLNSLELVKRFRILCRSNSFIICCSANLNLLVIGDKRTVSIYNLFDGEFIKFFVIGENVNDGIVDMRFMPMPGFSTEDNLIISSMSGMVTSIRFTDKQMLRKVLIETSKEKLFFCLVEDMKLFYEPRMLVIRVKKDLTMISNVDPKNLKKLNKVEKDTVSFKSEYSCHCIFANCCDSSSYTVIVGTRGGKVFIIQYTQEAPL